MPFEPSHPETPPQPKPNVVSQHFRTIYEDAAPPQQNQTTEPVNREINPRKPGLLKNAVKRLFAMVRPRATQETKVPEQNGPINLDSAVRFTPDRVDIVSHAVDAMTVLATEGMKDAASRIESDGLKKGVKGFFSPEEIGEIIYRAQIYMKRIDEVRDVLGKNKPTDIQELTKQMQQAVPETNVQVLVGLGDYAQYWVFNSKTMEAIVNHVFQTEVTPQQADQNTNNVHILVPEELAYLHDLRENGPPEKEIREVTAILLEEKIQLANEHKNQSAQKSRLTDSQGRLLVEPLTQDDPRYSNPGISDYLKVGTPAYNARQAGAGNYPGPIGANTSADSQRDISFAGSAKIANAAQYRLRKNEK